MRRNRGKRPVFALALAFLCLGAAACVHAPGAPPPSSGKAVTAFSFDIPAEVVVLNEAEGTISVALPYGTHIRNLAPAVEHTGASLRPAPGLARDFSKPVVYTVTASDGSARDYRVTVTVAEPSGNADLREFSVSPGELEPPFSSERTAYSAVVPAGTARVRVDARPANIHSVLGGQAGKSVDLKSGEGVVTVSVTAQDGTRKDYTVAVRAAAPGSATALPASAPREAPRAPAPVPGRISAAGPAAAPAGNPATRIIDHRHARLSVLRSIPPAAIVAARARLRLAYGHTSHGSQVTDGMKALASFPGAPGGGIPYRWNRDGSGGALCLHDGFVEGDLGNPDRTAWAVRTRGYLDRNPGVNVVMWSWCGQAGWARESEIETYLDRMARLEKDYPGVAFVYMTGHLDGTGSRGNLHLRNEQIRAFCRANGKWLFDFADIERFDPDGVDYLDLMADDGCRYDPAGGTNRSKNWAVEWQNRRREGVDWYRCGAAHTQPLNANLKAYAAWYLFARLAGWGGSE